MSTILVTGGAGFIGSNLIDKLLQKANKVITIDNFNNYYSPEIKEKNISDIKRNMNRLNINQCRFKLYREDIRDKVIMKTIFQENKIDAVVHLAAMAGVRASIENPELYYDVNINGTLNLLECCRRSGVKRFIFASSSSVYGNNEKVPFNENDFVDNPISPYAATKKAGELMCYTYYHLYDISTICLRFFTVYGQRQRPDLAIYKFTKLILEDKPISIYGDGMAQRDYTYIEDIIDGILRAIDFAAENPKTYEVFNLGESKTISLCEMVSTIEEVTGKNAIKERLPVQMGDVKKTFADITKARELMGYSPGKRFREGVEDFIKWLKKH